MHSALPGTVTEPTRICYLHLKTNPTVTIICNMRSKKNGISKRKSKPNLLKKKKGPRGGVTHPFPVKLHALLDNNPHEEIISWQPHGRAFLLHSPDEFQKVIMPKHFKQTKIPSFTRQLNLYGFNRLTSGPDKGAYYHDLFMRGRAELCTQMLRTRVKGKFKKVDPQSEPNFYAMPIISPQVYKIEYGDTTKDHTTKSPNSRQVKKKKKKSRQEGPIPRSDYKNVDDPTFSPISVVNYPPPCYEGRHLTRPHFLEHPYHMGGQELPLVPKIFAQNQQFSIHTQSSNSAFDRPFSYATPPYRPTSRHNHSMQSHRSYQIQTLDESLNDLSMFPDPLAQDDDFVLDEETDFQILDDNSFSCPGDIARSFDMHET